MSTAQELFGKGNESFVAENYDDAVKLYTQAIEEDDSKDDYYSNRSHAYIKLEKYIEAVEDATKSLAINCKNTKAYLRKGIANYYLEKIEAARESFMEGQKLDTSDKQFQLWIEKCDEKFKTEPEETDEAEKQDKELNKVTEEKDTEAASKDIPMPTGPKTRYDWYQTETHVVITIMLKNINKEDLHVDVEELTLSATVKLPSGSDYSLELDLAHSVVPTQTICRALTSKVEIKLKKQDGIRWQTLERDVQQESVKYFDPAADKSSAKKYPSSSHYTRDWDKLVAEIKQEEKDEKPEGDAALNQLFQQIYADGSDEVKRAMNKSFQESGGTVLSTNWKEIGEKKVEVKPPDGMEYKQWEY